MNHLSKESSPYLLQHAENPVDWHPWGSEALNKAKTENKLMIISIGYSACHWCHVMEKESFEDETIAALMNEHFISLKVDREERPDIDAIYMDAVQLINGNGGWPLNCIALPDGQAVYGGTYFPKERWAYVLKTLASMWKEQGSKLKGQAEEISRMIRSADKENTAKGAPGNYEADIPGLFASIIGRLDGTYGGLNPAPKFPMPVLLDAIMDYSYSFDDQQGQGKLITSLKKMHEGGIYDQLAGGFSRYSVDNKWNIPHFEKMLYDNAQLISVYSKAWKKCPEPSFKKLVHESLAFMEEEFTNKDALYYSAIDADSEGREGWYYTWPPEELKTLAADKYPLLMDYFALKEDCLLDGRYVLQRNNDTKAMAQKHKLSVQEVESIITENKQKLIRKRKERIAPEKDNKIITSWNMLMIQALIDAYRAFGDEKHLLMAMDKTRSLLGQAMQDDGSLLRIFNEKKHISAFLDDYAYSIYALIRAYEVSMDEKLLSIAHQLSTYVLDHFSSKQSSLFYYTSDQQQLIISRKKDVQDSVHPSGNSVMAMNLILLSHYYGRPDYEERARNMLAEAYSGIKAFPSYHGLWLKVLMLLSNPLIEVVIVGPMAKMMLKELLPHITGKSIIAATEGNSSLPIHQNRYMEGMTLIYLCKGKSCLPPVQSTDAAIKLLKGD